jgi:hypothetical protein
MAVSIRSPEFRPKGELGKNSWAEWPFISCQLDLEMQLGGWSDLAALGRASPNNSGGCGSRPGLE